ncbi:MAG: diguanylate cyclase [Glaciecola sp.]
MTCSNADNKKLLSSIPTEIHSGTSEVEQLRSENLLLSTLLEISELSHNIKLDINTLYAQIHQLLSTLIDTSNFYVARVNRNNQTIEFVYYQDTYGDTYEYPDDFPVRKMGNGVTELVINKSDTVLLSKKELTALSDKKLIAHRKLLPASWLGVPLVYGDETIGAIVVQTYTNRSMYTDADAKILAFVSQHICAVIKRHEAQQLEQDYKAQLAFDANHDTLTGLLNRRAFLQRFSDVLVVNDVAILFIDLDGFKAVNDNYGHATGDELLIRVAERLSNIQIPQSYVCRFGGDEFVVLLHNKNCIEEAEGIANRIIKQLAKPIVISGKTIDISASIGIATQKQGSSMPETIMHNADLAMYRAKKKGKNQFCYADERPKK